MILSTFSSQSILQTKVAKSFTSLSLREDSKRSRDWENQNNRIFMFKVRIQDKFLTIINYFPCSYPTLRNFHATKTVWSKIGFGWNKDLLLLHSSWKMFAVVAIIADIVVKLGKILNTELFPKLNFENLE